MSITYASPNTPVIVTGAASGIGKACALALAETGRNVALWDLDGQTCEQFACELAQSFGIAAIGLAVDVADLEAIATGVSQSREALGPIGGLAHCAGISGVCPLEQLDASTWQRVMDVNLRSEAFIIQALLPDLRSLPGAAIVTIASINATLGNRINPIYSASKGGMLALNRALADDLADHGIRINTVSPGQIATPMLLGSLEAQPDVLAAFERHTLLGRLGEPREVAAAVRFLLSDEASFITATELERSCGNLSSQRS